MLTVSGSGSQPHTPSAGVSRGILAPLALLSIALALRLWQIDEDGLGHPENFAPGLDLPSWVRFPPPRHDVDSVLRGTLVDGHPPAYFLGLLAWVQAFGASLLSLRLPSAVLGAASVVLLYRVALCETGRRTALFAAGLLALHGFHVHWSQLARMYVPVAFLGLCSTLCLWRVHARGRARDHVAYALATIAALWTQIYAWPLVAAQMLWTALGALAGAERRAAWRTQVLVLVASMPVVQLSLYQNPGTGWREPFAAYFGIGNLFARSLKFWGERPWQPPTGWLVAFGAALIVLGLCARASSSTPPRAPAPDAPGSRPAWEWLLAIAVGAAMLCFAALLGPIRPRSNATVWASSSAPLLLVALAPWGARLLEDLRQRSARVPAPRWYAHLLPSALFAIVPAVLMIAVSVVRGVYVARGTVVFLPFLLLLVARGIAWLCERRSARARLAGAAAAVAVIALHLASLPFAYRAEGSPRDYRGLARELERRAGPDDLILVRNDYMHQPLLY